MVSLNSIKVWFKASVQLNPSEARRLKELVPLNPSEARRLKDFAHLREKFFLIKTKRQ